MKKVCIVGASAKLGQYMVRHALARGNKVAGVCRERSIGKLDAFMVWDTINNKASW
jgi:putative NADH-flavin reductase